MTEQQGFSPSMQQIQMSPGMAMMPMHGSVDSSGLVERLLVQQKDMMEQQQANMEQQRQAMEAKMEQQQAKMEQQRKELEAKMEQQKAELTALPPAAITDEQLAALQARIEGLHAAKLLTDDELFVVEDIVADYVELTMSATDRLITKDMIYAMPNASVARQLDKLVGLSTAMVGEAAFARQLRRKFL
jgi:hypothetical protein